jgi:hypothetical protein
MECYRRQTFEGRRENLSQANKLSRTYAVLLEAISRHRGKCQQNVTVEHTSTSTLLDRHSFPVTPERERFDHRAEDVRPSGLGANSC